MDACLVCDKTTRLNALLRLLRFAIRNVITWRAVLILDSYIMFRFVVHPRRVVLAATVIVCMCVGL